jgi:NCS1 family nucleobase:cation symporter-1
VERGKDDALTCQGGVQIYFMGQFISVMLRCIFPSWARIENTIPVSQAITTFVLPLKPSHAASSLYFRQDLVGFVLAFIVTIPFMLIHTTKIHWRQS